MVRRKRSNFYKKILKRQKAFTIVELLVVIVIIGILAGLTVVAYSGISRRANLASVQADLSNAYKQIKIFQAEHGVYPNSVTDCSGVTPADGNMCLKKGANNTIVAYVSDNNLNPQGFCLNIKNTDVNNYKITSTKYAIPTNTSDAGDCYVHATANVEYSTTGSYTWVVPSGVNSVKIEAWGGQGAQGMSHCFEFIVCGFGGAGGLGGYASGNLAVSPGNNIGIYVGRLGEFLMDQSLINTTISLAGTEYINGQGGGTGGDGWLNYDVQPATAGDGNPGDPGGGVVNTADGKLTNTSVASGKQSGEGKAKITWELNVYDY